jgi:hypothetical protein
MEHEQSLWETGVGTNTYHEPPGIIDGSATGGRKRLKLVFTVIMAKFPGNPRHGCDCASRLPA